MNRLFWFLLFALFSWNFLSVVQIYAQIAKLSRLKRNKKIGNGNIKSGFFGVLEMVVGFHICLWYFSSTWTVSELYYFFRWWEYVLQEYKARSRKMAKSSGNTHYFLYWPNLSLSLLLPLFEETSTATRRKNVRQNFFTAVIPLSPPHLDSFWGRF